MRALLVALMLAPVSALAQDRCILDCDRAIEGAEARAAAETLLGASLPKEAKVIGLLTGGFQDQFVQLRIDLPDSPAIDAVLAPLGTFFEALGAADGTTFGPDGPDWWDVADRGFLRVGSATLPGFASATVGVAPAAEGEASVFIWAFQT